MSERAELEEERRLDDEGLEAIAEMFATPPPRALRDRVLHEVGLDARTRLTTRRRPTSCRGRPPLRARGRH